MGSAIWIEIRGRPFKETADDCCKMHRLADELDDLATRLGVRKLSRFFDWTEMARAADAETAYCEFRDGLREEEPEPEFRNITSEPLATRDQEGEWFDSSQGLGTIQALRSYLDEHAEAIELSANSVEDLERYRRELLAEFQLCEQLLIEAVASGQQFRLVIVP
jgi:hypothetical protein